MRRHVPENLPNDHLSTQDFEDIFSLKEGMKCDLTYLRNQHSTFTKELPSLIFLQGLSDDDLQTCLISHLDSLDGIITHKTSSSRFHNGVGYVRNATCAKELKDRLASDDPHIMLDSMLLRTLSTLRAIKHTLNFYKDNLDKLPDNYFGDFTSDWTALDKTNFFARIINYFDDAHRNHLNKSLNLQSLDGDKKKAQSEIKLLEVEFNSFLIKALHESGLDEGIGIHDCTAGYEKLLMHYRNLSAALDPAPSQLTITCSEERNSIFWHAEISHPIAEKTQSQKVALECMKALDSPKSAEKNFHNSQKKCAQMANKAFAELLQSDTRRLADQTRKTHAPTVKNGYFCESRRFFTDNQKIITNMDASISLRFASLAYVGKGENANSRTLHAQQNLFQLQDYVKKHTGSEQRLHITLLNTYAPDTGQHIIVPVTESAVRGTNGVECSYMPVNALGVTREPQIAQIVRDHDNSPSFEGKKHSLPNAASFFGRIIAHATIFPVAFQLISSALKSVRNRFAGWITYISGKIEGVISASTCASGRDRTGTNQEIMEVFNICESYEKQGIPIDFSTAARLHAKGSHNSMLASLACPGSHGMKKCSCPGNLFPAEVSKQLYRKTAETNKACPVSAGYALSLRHSPPLRTMKNDVLMVLQGYVNSRKGAMHNLGLLHSYELTTVKVKYAKAAIATIENLTSLEAVLAQLTDLREKAFEATNLKRQVLFFRCIDDGNLIARIDGLINKVSKFQFAMLCGRLRNSIQNEDYISSTTESSFSGSQAKEILRKVDAGEIVTLDQLRLAIPQEQESDKRQQHSC